MADIIYTIKAEDVGRGLIGSSKHCPCCGIMTESISLNVKDLMGRIMPRDVGKRIMFTGRVYQVENDEQLKARQQREVKGGE